jgi:hypothetical protein
VSAHLVGLGAGELNVPGNCPADEGTVDKLSAIIRGRPTQPERQARGLHRPGFTCGALLRMAPYAVQLWTCAWGRLCGRIPRQGRPYCSTRSASLNPRICPYFSPARRTAMVVRSPLPAIGGGQPFGAIAPPCGPEQAVDGPIHKYADGLPLWHTARGLTF